MKTLGEHEQRQPDFEKRKAFVSSIAPGVCVRLGETFLEYARVDNPHFPYFLLGTNLLTGEHGSIRLDDHALPVIIEEGDRPIARLRRIRHDLEQAQTRTRALRRKAEFPGVVRYHWHESSVHSYDETFAPLLPEGRSLADLVALRIAQNKTAVALDIMASTRFLHDVRPTAGLAVGLSDVRSLQRKEEDAEAGIDLLTGDITAVQTLNSIRSWAQQHAPDGVNFIFSRGVIGVSTLPKHKETNLLLLSRLYQLLSSDNGEMFLQLPIESHHFLTDGSLDALRYPGIDLETYLPPRETGMEANNYPIIHLMKKHDAPLTILPRSSAGR